MSPRNFRFAVLASGSKGNCAMVAVGENRFLIDAGISVSQVRKRLRQIGECDTGFRGIFLTHMHGDHTAYADQLLKHLFAPIYSTAESYSPGVTPTAHMDWREIKSRYMVISPPQPTLDWRGNNSPLEVASYEVPHCPGALAFVFKWRRRSVVFAHDLGSVPKEFLKGARGAHVIAVESNYSPEMIRISNRVPAINDRIESDEGHLSNNQCAEFLARVKSKKLHTVVLLHISKASNLPVLAQATAAKALGINKPKHDSPILDSVPRLILASQDHPTEVIEV